MHIASGQARTFYKLNRILLSVIRNSYNQSDNLSSGYLNQMSYPRSLAVFRSRSTKHLKKLCTTFLPHSSFRYQVNFSDFFSRINIWQPRGAICHFHRKSLETTTNEMNTICSVLLLVGTAHAQKTAYLRKSRGGQRKGRVIVRGCFQIYIFLGERKILL